MDELEYPVMAFFAAVSEELESCVLELKAGNEEAANDAMERAVELCEQHPAYALRPSPQLQSSLHKVVRGCISNAISEGRP